MSRQANHDQRRIQIIEATWRIIARGGFAAATMREIAAEAGFANGGLKHYFTNKDELLAAAFQRTFYRINERAALTVGESKGLEAIRCLCLEMLPLDEERTVESRVTVAFWDRTSVNKQLMKIHADSFAIWRHWMQQHLDLARGDDQLPADLSNDQIIDQILCVTAGLKVITLPDPKTAYVVDQVAVLDGLLARVALKA
ncbi:MAG TPA: TetR/AcrR family transcriptional regulator [Lacisediminihabitans sp.]|nr:TetR/AcrR family transcriptional regulator [Lacisediminihabitans sp.]HXD61182.1 TetR/AcrR family transcriptional regulator [Lacisediminihabitans sp.]